APNARMGTVDTITEEQFIEMARPGDLVLARTNAPLVAMCYTLISAGVPAKVSGRDVSAALRTMTMNAACFIDGRVQKDKYRTGISTEDFLVRLDNYSEFLLNKAERQAERTGTDSGLRVMTITDRNMVIKTICEASRAKTVSRLISDLSEIFKGDSEENVLLATAHGAKGLEAESVYILEAGQFPSSRAASPAELYAEACAEFVAYSRAMKRMLFVGDDAGKIPQDVRGWDEED
ncbi:MAG: 3'-5' exonuclease, partial [Deinococcus sp.]|nr:3'-5' exonuclease [Deinococcus sp.]